jgi:glycerol-3-phosphate dehydrogenase
MACAVPGSHLLLRHMLEVPGERRIVFALPYQQQCLLGTTEVRQQLDEPVQCSPAERDYLLDVYAHYFTPAVAPAQLLGSFAGVRPLLAGSADASRASREYQFHWQGNILTVSGGKWTTARALGQQLAAEVNRR